MRILLLFVSAGLFAQGPLSFGLKGGIVRNSAPGSEIFPLKGGPFVELKLPFLPRIESGLMLERFEAGPVSATVYQVPVLLKKRMSSVAVQPFLSGGMTYRRIPRFDRSHAGLTVAGGLSFNLLLLKIEPEFRYTRWIRESFSPRPQQTEFLIGIRF